MDTELLAELIRRKHEVLVPLRDLSRRQILLVGDGEVTSLLGVLSAKQTLLEELQQIDRRLDPYRDQDPESRRWRSLDDRRRCQQMAQACAALLGEIMLLEKHSEADVLLRQGAAAQRLAGVHSHQQARHAYSRSSASGGGRFDLTSER